MAGGRLWLDEGWGAPQANSGKTGWQIMNEKSIIKALRFLMMSNNVTGRACYCVMGLCVKKCVSKERFRDNKLAY